jgi:hypothetical protein
MDGQCNHYQSLYLDCRHWSHSPLHIKPFFAKNWTKSPNKMVVVMGNGQTEEVAKTGTFEGTAVKQNKEKQGNVKLSNVVYLPNGKYNLISITKVMENGWNLKGDLDGLKLVKEDKEFIFDIKIKTLTGF